MHVMYTELKRYSLVRRRYLSKKSWSKQKGCVNGRKVKRWQKWDPKNLGEFVHLSSMIQSSPVNGVDDKTILESTSTYIQGFSPHHHGYDMVTVEKKSTFDVNMEDLVWKYKESQINRHRSKRSRKRRQIVNKDNSGKHFKNAQRHKQHTEIYKDNSNQISFIYCQIKNSDFSEFSDSVQHSFSCYPPVLHIPVDKETGDDNSTTDISLAPGLLFQELASSAVNGPKNQIGHYRSVTYLEIYISNICLFLQSLLIFIN